MASINKVIIVGRLGSDPELRATPSNRAVCRMSVATSEVYKDKAGNKKETTEWHRVVAWGPMGESCAKYLAKGSLVYIEGRIQTESWDDQKSGQKRYATNVVASKVEFLDTKKSGAGRSSGWGEQPKEEQQEKDDDGSIPF